MTSLRVQAALLALVAAAAASCGDGGEGPAAAAPPSSAGREARFASGVLGRDFDPGHAGTAPEALLQHQVYECLFEYDPAAPDPTTVRPLLAESWQVSEDARTWTFTLRRDAVFHDPWDPPLWPGRERPVTAADVAWSWLRQADARGERNAWWEFAGLIAGLDALHEATADGGAAADEAWERAVAEGVAGLEVLDERRLRVTLRRPEPALPGRLAAPAFAVVPPEADRPPRRLADRPVGSGPFRVAAWEPGQRVHFLAVPDWRGDPSPFGDGTLPFLAGFRWERVRESTTRTLMFERGELDRLRPGTDALGRFFRDGALKPSWRERGFHLAVADEANTTFLVFAMSDPVVGHVPGDEAGNVRRRALRRALALAFPYDDWHRLERAGLTARPARSFVARVLPGSADLPAFPWRDGGLDEARRVLDDAGDLADLPPLTIDLPGAWPSMRSVGEVYASRLGELGIRTELRALPWATFLDRAVRGEYQVAFQAWGLDWPDPLLALAPFHGGERGTPTNLSGFADPEFDRLFARCRDEPDPEARLALIAAMHEILYAEVPAAPIDHGRAVILFQPWVEHGFAHPFEAFAPKFLRRGEAP